MYLIEGLLPLLRILQFLCISPFSVSIKTRTIDYSRFFTIYSCLSFIILIILFIHTIFLHEIFVIDPHDALGTTIDLIQLIGIRIVHIIIIAESYWKRNEQMAILKKLMELDEILVHKLSIDISYKKLLKCIWITVVSLIIIYLGIQITFLVFCWTEYKSNLLNYWLVYLIPFIVISLRYWQTVITIWLIKLRFNLLNNQLLTIHEISTSPKKLNSINNNKMMNYNKNISENKEIVTIKSIKNKIMGDQKIKFNVLNLNGTELLIIIRDAYDRLWNLSKLINNCYGCSTLFNIANSTTSITANFYFLIISLATSNLLFTFGTLIWTIPHLINIIAIATICHLTVETANQTPLIAHKIDYDLINDNNNVFIEKFSLQLLHQKILFTAFGFFNVDFTLLFTIMGSITAYIVILIQLHINSESNKQIS